MSSDPCRLATSTRAMALACALIAWPSLPLFMGGLAGVAFAQTANRDHIGDLIERTATDSGTISAQKTDKTPPADPRAGDPQFEQAAALMSAVDAILKDSADNRSDAERLPSRDEFILPPLWRETREDREEKVRNLLDAALSIVTNVPVVEIQKRVEGLRKNIRELEDENAHLKERQLTAPKDAIVSDTVSSIQATIDENVKRVEANRDAIKAAKGEIADALKTSGIELGTDQVDLLLDSVLSGDLVRLVAAFEAARLIDGQLAKLISTTGDNMNSARKYFAMHAALFAMLVRAQDATITKIDTQYMPKLDAILGDIKAAKAKTSNLLKAENRPDQKRALEANRESQRVAEDAAQAYRRYLQGQREQIARARVKAVHDLRIADNTYETVEASVQLRNLMRDSSASFEAIQKLEAPSFEHIFKNDELRREFENLTRRLDAPSS
ncbi:MAG: hypothetical protein R3D51_09695 [Hyphomicrobiaceae bacterium]